MLSDRKWELAYTTDDGPLAECFYVPALRHAVRYDRLTGYFNAGALTLAARGIEGLVRNNGVMRMIVGCTLEQEEIGAIQRGDQLRNAVEQRLASIPLAPDPNETDALELLAWMVARKHLEVKVAVPCDAGARRPIPNGAIFHEKTGVVEDRAGDRVAWTGSLNETPSGWQYNWERIQVYTSWRDGERVAGLEADFDKLWNDQARRATVLTLPEAVRRDLLRFLPKDDKPPARLQEREETTRPGLGSDSGLPPGLEGTIREPSPPTYGDADADKRVFRDRVWSFIKQAPAMAGGGGRVGEATAAVEPWPHQARAFRRMYDGWPPRLLVADEVGLGKTIQAGMLLRQAWLSGRAKRILVLAPKAVLRQWQVELYEKFNLNWPIYDKGEMTWHPSPALRGRHVRPAASDRWHQEPVVIASSYLMRRSDRRQALLEDAEPWDLIVLDEAHHARRRGAAGASDGAPNTLLRLMEGLKDRTKGLVLLTATPMQVRPGELWDLLQLLGLPPEWTPAEFVEFFEHAQRADPTPAAFERMARLFQATERRYGAMAPAQLARALEGLSRLQARKVVRALRDRAETPRRQLSGAQREAALRLMRVNTPVRRLVSRHTRELLREYHRRGLLATRIADRDVDDRFVQMSADERELYEAVEEYIATTYNQASEEERRAVGFVMTIYRRRLASSFRALRRTLERRVGGEGGPSGDTAGGTGGTAGGVDADPSLAEATLAEDVSDDEVADDPALDEDAVAKALRESLRAEEAEDVRRLLDQIARLPPDSKLAALKDALDDLRERGHRQVMVFTQYTDTMDFLREELAGDAGALEAGTARDAGSAPASAGSAPTSAGSAPTSAGSAPKLMCYSGRGGEVPGTDGWRPVDRDTVKRRFRDGQADVLLCTEAAAEGLNFQFCGALVNYDMPWNPMRVEQRIGRIDRVGQQHPTIRIVNLHYADTVETDIYRVLRERIGLFAKMVGRLQPILARLPGTITRAVLSGEGGSAAGRRETAKAVEAQASEAEGGFDIDAALDEVLDDDARPEPLVTMTDLDRVIGSPDLLAPDTRVQPLGNREYGFTPPGSTEPVRVTTDPDHHRDHPDSVELWSPGNRLFRAPEGVNDQRRDWPPDAALKDILDGRPGSS